MFSLDDENSFQVVDVIRKEVENYKDNKKDLAIVVLGNKSDIHSSKRQVETVQALNWAARTCWVRLQFGRSSQICAQ